MDYLKCGQYQLPVDRPLVMGIVNLTPDSFSSDGVADSVERAVGHARAQLEAGADILDLGAESTRPGAPPVSAEDELRRLMPVLEQIVGWGVPISVDTYKPAVMRQALRSGASMFNDISGVRHPDSLALLAESDCAVCIMHMQGEPREMQNAPCYGDVVSEVLGFLAEQAKRCVAAGVARERIVLDPGFGFGKALDHNLALFRALPEVAGLGYPVLAGVSRKSMLGAITGRGVGERVAASVSAALLAAQKNAKILRVHDVSATVDALRVWSAIERGN